MIGDLLLATMGSDELPERIPLKSVYHAFWELSRLDKYIDWFSSISFVMGPDVPVSEEIESALFKFCSSGLGTVDNPDFRYLRIAHEKRKAMREVLKRHLQDKDSEKLRELEELAKDFKNAITSSMKNAAESLSLQRS